MTETIQLFLENSHMARPKVLLKIINNKTWFCKKHEKVKLFDKV